MELLVIKVADKGGSMVNYDVATVTPSGVWKPVPTHIVAPFGG